MKRALLLLLVGGTAWAINIRYTGLKCQSVDTTYCIIEHCVMKPMRRGVKQVTGVVKLLKLPVSNISLTLQLQRRGQSKQILYSVSIDGCKFWDTKRRNPIANALYKYFRFDAYTNMNHSCPYNHDIIFDNFRLDDTHNWPLPISPGDYVINSSWYSYNVLRALAYITLQVD
ncbi:uncharacterized protein LOC117134726 [Drosophila busckii]|uniref:uncharacterized protein LOC117134726 n=1 Tax=Drosophila busckii TaxID=30019 RepID=UPI001432A6A2|nr:uncharacterized protein LOC117134726 [Drosophila busckii]